MKNEFSGKKQTQLVSSFDELIGTAFNGEVNAIGWERKLDGDFKEIVANLQFKEAITTVSIDDLQTLALSEEGCKARAIIIDDINLLEAFGAAPVLNLIRNYPRDDDFDVFPTDVYSYHVDRSPISTDTFLCTYHGSVSEIIPNDQAEQKVLIPEFRKELETLSDGSEIGFEDFVKAHFYDLHYQAKPNASPISLGTGNLWKLAVDHPGQNVLPCIHRAPFENEDEYRLLLIC
ncbi:DUF1826 domain-containing protein [Pedobacter aquatilis]|uniref:DUF1826 domain-containing protein n=1 Tax=Pedobacter aquatilis TaxID=351343 RepID=UPI00292CFB46|nr:DUF1826 domain-containing protein [Pedobacter aquatilis]